MQKENTEIKIKGHCKLDLEFHHGLLRNNEILNQVQDDEGHWGFTLIELLVVVLIIGILAAVAVPQYNKAVAKSRLATLKKLAHSIKEAEEVYYLENGTYINDFSKLSIEMPGGQKNNSYINRYFYDWGECFLFLSDEGWERILCTEDNLQLRYSIYFDHAAPAWAGKRRCIVVGTTDLTDWRNSVCKAETNNASPQVDRSAKAIIYFYP